MTRGAASPFDGLSEKEIKRLGEEARQALVIREARVKSRDTCTFDGCLTQGDLTTILCSKHRYIHGYAWVARHSQYAGEFPVDYELYAGKRVGPL